VRGKAKLLRSSHEDAENPAFACWEQANKGQQPTADPPTWASECQNRANRANLP
jgi:hypothetical protein